MFRFFSDRERDNCSLPEKVINLTKLPSVHSTTLINHQWGYSENYRECQLLIKNTALVLTGPLPHRRADGIENRYVFRTLDINSQINISILYDISVPEGLNLKKAMQQQNLTELVDSIRNIGGETSADISNCLIARFDISDRSIIPYHADEPDIPFYPVFLG